MSHSNLITKDSDHGEAGNDALFSGWKDEKDELFGGDGADRFVIMEGNQAARNLFNDVTAEDVLTSFKNGSKNWTTEEIELMDKSFAILHEATGNTDLLKHDGNGLVFERLAAIQDPRGITISGQNHDHGRITISDAGLSGHETWQVGNALHEVAHNWDTAQDNPQLWNRFLEQSGWIKSAPGMSLSFGRDGLVSVQGPGGYLRRYQSNDRGGYASVDGTSRTLEALPGGGYKLTETDGQATYYDAKGAWTGSDVRDANGNLISHTVAARSHDAQGALTRYDVRDANGNLTSYTVASGGWAYRTDAKFASDYARTNPREDFAESFTAYFLQKTGRNWSDYKDGSGANSISGKIALIDGWVTGLKPRSS